MPSDQRIRELEADVLRLIDLSLDNEKRLEGLEEDITRMNSFIRKLLHLIREDQQNE